MGGPIPLVARHIDEADNPFACYDSPQRGSLIVTIWPDGTTLPDPIAKLRLAVHGTKMKALTIPSSEVAKGRFAQPRCFFQDSVEHRHEVAGR